MTRTNEEIREAIAGSDHTSWDELRTAGKELQESSSTTHPPNSRFVVIRNGTVLNEDERDTFLTHQPPLYELTVQPGDEVIVQGTERNAYLPGSDFVTRSATEVETTGPDGQYLPSGVTIETGYADLTGDAGFGPALPANGVVVEMTADDVVLQNYIGGTVSTTASLEEGEWNLDIFDDSEGSYGYNDDFRYDLSQFSLKAIRGNLYGAGDIDLYIKFRDLTGRGQYVKVATIGEVEDPITNRYNLFVTSARVSVNADADPFTLRVGPLNYFNEVTGTPPERRKNSVYRNVSVGSTLGADNFDVVTVYRADPDYRQATTQLDQVTARAADDGRVEVREVHPDYLDFGGLDPTIDSNWATPPNQRPNETSLQELDAAPGTATLSLDANNNRRGIQRGVVEFSGGQGNESAETKSGAVHENLSEFYYMVVGAQSAGTAIDRIQVTTRQRW